MQRDSSVIRLRWIAGAVAIGLTGLTTWLFYQALFVLDRFGLFAILFALASLLAATMLWWLAIQAKDTTDPYAPPTHLTWSGLTMRLCCGSICSPRSTWAEWLVRGGVRHRAHWLHRLGAHKRHLFLTQASWHMNGPTEP